MFHEDLGTFFKSCKQIYQNEKRYLNILNEKIDINSEEFQLAFAKIQFDEYFSNGKLNSEFKSKLDE